MALVAAVAQPFDVLEALDDSGRRPAAVTGRRFGLFARQLANGAAFSLREEGGALVMLAGLYPDGETAEAWFLPGPAMRRHMTAAMRAWRRWAAAIGAQLAAPLPLVAYVAENSVAGDRLATWCGFQAGETREIAGVGKVTTWRRLLCPASPNTSSA